MNQAGKRLDVIDYIKGIAIILVVVYHYTPPGSPLYWTHIVHAVSSIHMPAFFAVSGFLFFKSTSGRSLSFKDVFVSKVKRLGVPYVSVALLFIPIKLFSQLIFNIDHSVNAQTLWAVLVSPVVSHFPLLWFMYSLFSIVLIVKLFEKVVPPLLLFIAAIILNYIVPDGGVMFSAGATLKNIPFFLVGYLSYPYITAAPHIRLAKVSWWGAFLLFVLAFVGYKHFNQLSMNTLSLLKLVLGFLGVFLVTTLSSCLLEKRWASSLRTIGLYSMSIYLFHLLFESFIKYVVQKSVISVWVPFLSGAVLAISAGIVFPLLLEKHLLRRYVITRRLFLGLN